MRSETKRKILGAIVCCIVLGQSAIVMADQNINIEGVIGSVSHGDTLIINGSGFGIKSPALPMVWDDFEGNAVGTSIGNPVIGSYSRVGITTYTDVTPYTGGMCAYSEIKGVPGFPGLVSNWIPLESKDGFASMKVKMVSAYGSLAPHNIKLIRLNAHDPDPTHGRPNYNVGCDRTRVAFNAIANHGLLNQVYAGGFESIPIHNDWNSISILAHVGDMETPNGFVERVLNDDIFKRDNIVTLREGGLTGYRSAFFCGYFTHDGSDAEIFLDDVYADITTARVELFSSDGFHEMQVPVAWSDNQLEVIVNLGRYVNGETLKLVVYDGDNNESPAHTFVLDTGEVSTGPGRPGQPYYVSSE